MPKLGRKLWVYVAVLLLGVGSLGAAGAEPPSVSKLRESGMVAYRAGNYAEAKQAFDEAFRLSPLPSVGVWAARARVKLGQWVEADAHYELLQKAPVNQAETAEAEARAQAVRERERLRQRIPRLRIRLEGADASAVEVSVDGTLVSDEYLGVKKSALFPRGRAIEVNPGDHKVVGVAGEQRREASVTLEEGQTRDVTLRFVNPDTLRQRKCADQCRADCDGDNKCYVECKHRCFTKD